MPMRAMHDQLVKRALEQVLDARGVVYLQMETGLVDVQYIDVYFEPYPLTGGVRPGCMGLLDRMSTQPCLIEPFSKTPGLEAIWESQRKHLTLHHRKYLDARRAAKEEMPVPPLPPLWVLTRGRPETALL